MGCPLYASLKTYAQLESPTRCICLIPRRPHDESGNGLAERLLYPYGMQPWALIQCNRVTCHQSTVSSLGGGG